MRILSEAALRRFRAMSEGMMGSTATVTRPGEFVDEGGGAGHIAPGTSHSFPCRLMPISLGENETEIADQPTLLHTLRLFFPLDVDLQADDAPVIDGTRYEVVGIQPRGTYSVDRRAMVRRVGDPEEA